MQVHQSVANNMLRNISDPKLRETYGAILSGTYGLRVHCLNPRINPISKKPYHKPGMPIGYITKAGKVIDACAVDKKGMPIAGIETSRDRFDGRKGFRCYCGNWSIQAAEEQPDLGGEEHAQPTPPTQEQMLSIHSRIQKSKKGALAFDAAGYAEYDGFGIQKLQEGES